MDKEQEKYKDIFIKGDFSCTYSIKKPIIDKAYFDISNLDISNSNLGNAKVISKIPAQAEQENWLIIEAQNVKLDPLKDMPEPINKKGGVPLKLWLRKPQTTYPKTTDDPRIGNISGEAYGLYREKLPAPPEKPKPVEKPKAVDIPKSAEKPETTEKSEIQKPEKEGCFGKKKSKKPFNFQNRFRETIGAPIAENLPAGCVNKLNTGYASAYNRTNGFGSGSGGSAPRGSVDSGSDDGGGCGCGPMGGCTGTGGGCTGPMGGCMGPMGGCSNSGCTRLGCGLLGLLALLLLLFLLLKCLLYGDCFDFSEWKKSDSDSDRARVDTVKVVEVDTVRVVRVDTVKVVEVDTFKMADTVYTGDTIRVTDTVEVIVRDTIRDVMPMPNVLFFTNSNKIRPTSLPGIRKLADFLAKYEQLNIIIEGHTDDRGKDDLNEQLSSCRAKAVYDQLIELGIAAERLKYEGYGERCPKESNKSIEGRTTNRRVEFRYFEESPSCAELVPTIIDSTDCINP